MLEDVISWHANGCLLSNLQYNHLALLFVDSPDGGAHFFDQFTRSFGHDASELLSYAKYAPATREGNRVLSQLMKQCARIGDFASTRTLFDWLHREGATARIDDFNVLLSALCNAPSQSRAQSVLSAWDLWCDIKGAPVTFDAVTVRGLVSVLQSHRNHLTLLIRELLSEYRALVTNDAEMVAHILPFVGDVEEAFALFQKMHSRADLCHEQRRRLCLGMLRCIGTNVDALAKERLWDCVVTVVGHYAADTDTERVGDVASIARNLVRLYALPKESKAKYKMDDAATMLSILDSQLRNGEAPLDTNYLRFLLDNTATMRDVERLCAEHGQSEAFTAQILCATVLRVVDRFANEIDSRFVAFVMRRMDALIATMDFDGARLGLKALSVLDKRIVNSDKGRFIATVQAIQQRMIGLFEENSERICARDSEFGRGHRCIVLHIDEVLGVISAFTKHRAYNERLMHLLCEQILSNLQRTLPRHRGRIFDLDAATAQRRSETLPMMPMYTSILRQLRHLNVHSVKLFSLIASSLQKRPDIISVADLREWALTFGAAQHCAHSIWLSIQSVLLAHFPDSDAVARKMSLDMLIDFVWSMTVLDLMPTHWLLADLIQMLNADRDNQRIQIEALSFVHKTRLWEIFQALYATASPMRTSSDALKRVDADIIDATRAFYAHFVVPQFHEQCKLRPSLAKFTQKLRHKNVTFEVGAAQTVSKMLPLCDIVIAQHRICVEVFDAAHVTLRSQQRTREWLKFKARRELTRRLIQNTELQREWHFVLVDGTDAKCDLDAFAKLIDKLVWAQSVRQRVAIDQTKSRLEPQTPTLASTPL